MKTNASLCIRLVQNHDQDGVMMLNVKTYVQLREYFSFVVLNCCIYTVSEKKPSHL